MRFIRLEGTVEMCIRDSPEAAQVQVAAVAENSGLSQQEVQEIVEENTEHKVLGVFGEERVNVLKCNLDIAGAMGLI